MTSNFNTKHQFIAFMIVDWLQSCLKEGIIPEEEKEGIEIATHCISETFSVYPCDNEQRKNLGINSQTLTNIFEQALQQTGSSSLLTTEFTASINTTSDINPNNKAKAEEFKSQGNNAMFRKDYSHAIFCYTEALKLFPKDVIYLSNRAAAYSESGDNISAIKDAKLALEINPDYGKAYSRLGHAYFSMGEYKEALNVYLKGLKVDPNSEVMKRGYELVKKNLTEHNDSAPIQEKNLKSEDISKTSNLNSSSETPRVGIPDFTSMMNNPAFMSVAQNLMSSGALNNLLNNPHVARLAQNIMSGEQTPNIQDIINDPEMRNIARNFMGSFNGGNARQFSDSN
ncbi:hypothetical protein PNEG_03443 [Pneumocystis murina B123]|uniref:SGTA homodimerisation domain-containing protein n=1 Tax=Pneumocystis murina (strain B123) TaxID=1069680 RepID=M7NIA4_PNEMU|nr:hypothetical protein PNEG_03443 [Pneumocystis murina B123]EMR08278.1 hypothetical protein PNEG_03443 [Pneumocystis murina B123]